MGNQTHSKESPLAAQALANDPRIDEAKRLLLEAVKAHQRKPQKSDQPILPSSNPTKKRCPNLPTFEARASIFLILAAASAMEL